LLADGHALGAARGFLPALEPTAEQIDRIVDDRVVSDLSLDGALPLVDNWPIVLWTRHWHCGGPNRYADDLPSPAQT
jgi:hypothetical protein